MDVNGLKNHNQLKRTALK